MTLLEIFTAAATEGDWVLYRVFGKRGDTAAQREVMRQVAKREGYTFS